MKVLCRVGDIGARTGDAGSILDDHEMRLRWVEAKIGVDEFPATQNRCCNSEADHTERIAAIDKWAHSCGGIGPALVQSPLPAHRSETGDPRILDGWHRLCVARRDGLATVRSFYVNRTLSD